MPARLTRLGRFLPDPLSFDRMLAALLALTAELEVWLGSGASRERLVAAVVAPAVAGTVAVRRLYPTSAGVAAAVLVSVELGFWGDPQVISNAVAYFCALYALTVWTPPRRFAFGLALVVTVDLATSAGPKSNLHDSGPITIATLVVMLLVRRVVGDRERRVQIAERERDVAAREAVVEERARIARELHDVIAHHVALMVVQAGAERRVLGDASASTREVLETVEKTGRSALTEMRRLLGMLRDDAHQPLTPQPGLDDVPKLVDQLREAGLPVALHVEGEPRGLPVGIELSAYRIVQEALTNSLKYANGAHAKVHVRYGPESLELEIADDGAGRAALEAGSGHGLVGMRERVALYGGRFDAGHDPGGGFAVKSRAPDSMTSILIADDQALVRVGLRKIVENETDMVVVGEASDGEEAVAASERWRPDVVVMDIRMPVLDGIEATRRIVRAQPSTHVLILTTFGLDGYVYDALRAGASGFMLKDATPEEFLSAVRIVAGGEALLAPAVTRAVIEEFARQRPPAARALPPAVFELTAREREVLDLLVGGLSNSEICRRLVISEATTKTHVAHILHKLDLRDRIQAVIYAYENGLAPPHLRD